VESLGRTNSDSSSADVAEQLRRQREEAEQALARQRILAARMAGPGDNHVPSNPALRAHVERIAATQGEESARRLRRSAYHQENRERVAFYESLARTGAIAQRGTSVPQRRQRFGSGRPRGRTSRPRATAGASRDGPSDEDEGGDAEPSSSSALSADSSNSRSRAADWPRWTVVAHGIDTVSLVWRDDRATDAFLRAASTGRLESKRGGSRWLSKPLRGMRVGVMPSRGMLVVEGRLVSICSGTEGAQGLYPPGFLAIAVARARWELEQLLGVSLTVSPLVRRADLATDARFEQAADGHAFLRGCAAALSVPRLMRHTHERNGFLESIDWTTPARRHIRVRLYDAGAHHGTEAPGRRIRLERQDRFSGQKQYTAEAFAATDLGARFTAPIRRWVESDGPIEVATVDAATDLILALLDDNRITPAKAATLLGDLPLLTRGSQHLTPRNRRRRERDLCLHGIALDAGSPGTRAPIDLRAVLGALAHAWNVEAA
jgi:hypothetical protein